MRWSEVVKDTAIVQDIRRQLIQKYLDQGRGNISREVAEQEVDIFLQDQTRSEEYIEMRLEAQAKAGEDLGLGVLSLQMIGGFLLGFLGMILLRHLEMGQSMGW